MENIVILLAQTETFLRWENEKWMETQYKEGDDVIVCREPPAPPILEADRILIFDVNGRGPLNLITSRPIPPWDRKTPKYLSHEFIADLIDAIVIRGEKPTS